MDLKPTTEYLDVAYGWLSPEGDFYKVEYYKHELFARQMGFDCAEDMENLGWVALRGCYWSACYRRNEKITQAQLNTITDWFMINEGRDIPLVYGDVFEDLDLSYLKGFEVE